MTLTTDLGLDKPSDGSSNAGESYNDALDTLDAGRTYKVTLGEAFSQYHVGYIASDGQAYLANADSETTARSIGFVTEAGDAAAERYFRYLGRIQNTDWNLNPGEPVYVSTSNGEITQTAPTSPNYKNEIGIAFTSNIVFARIPSYLDAEVGTQSVFKTITADTGSTTADSATDTLAIEGGTGISTEITGDTLTITGHEKYTDAEAIAAIKGDGDWNASNWDTAFGWGDHGGEGYLKTVDISDDTNLAVTAPVVLTDDTLSVDTATPSDGDTTHLSTADQIYDWVTGLGYGTMSDLVDDTSPELGGNLNVNNNNINNNGSDITIDDPINVEADQDIVCEIGRAQIGYDGTNADTVVLAHYDNMGTTAYGLKMSAANTVINAPTGGVVAVGVNNTTAFQVSATQVKNYVQTYIQETAAAAATAAGWGQAWVKNDNPNQLWFQDDAGNDQKLSGGLFIETGTYTGDGATSQVVSLTNSDLIVKYVKIWFEDTDGNVIRSHETTNTLVTQDAQGLAVQHYGDAAERATYQDDTIIALGTGSFTVDDRGTDQHPNSNGDTYHYVVFGTYI